MNDFLNRTEFKKFTRHDKGIILYIIFYLNKNNIKDFCEVTKLLKNIFF